MLRSAANLVLGVALFGVREDRGLGRMRRRGWGVAVALVIPPRAWKRSRCCAAARRIRAEALKAARSPSHGGGQPAAAAEAGSPLRAVTECSRLSREEISTMARIAPATAKPAPTRNAWSNPLVRATEALWTPEWKRLWVRLLAIVVRIASPTAPPICWEVSIRPDAGPASCGDRGDRHGHEREPEGRQRRRPSTSAANEPPVPGTGEPQQATGPAAVRRSASA